MRRRNQILHPTDAMDELPLRRGPGDDAQRCERDLGTASRQAGQEPLNKGLHRPRDTYHEDPERPVAWCCQPIAADVLGSIGTVRSYHADLDRSLHPETRRLEPTCGARKDKANELNGFVDLHVVFGDSAPPARSRLGNRWRTLATHPQMWVGAATSAGGPDITTATATGWTLWASGPVFSYRGQPDRPLERFAEDLATGRADAAVIDSHAVIVGLASSSSELSVWVNRMGTVHAYRGGRAGRAAIGTFMPAVAERSKRALDWVGITGFFGFGFYPGDRTMFDDVQILRPATRTVFDPTGAIVCSKRYWDWWFDPDYHATDDDLADEFHEVWTRTLDRQMAGTRSVIPVSGGLDSRTVFAAAVPSYGRAKHPVRTMTYGYSVRSPEMSISQRVAQARGQQAVELVVEPYLLDRLAEVADAVEGFQGLAYSRQASASATLEGLGNHVVGGHWGDVWFDSASPTTHLGSDELVSSAFSKFAKPGRGWALKHLCGPHIQEAPESVLRQVLSEEAVRVPDLGDQDMRLKALKTDQWSFRWTLASLRAYHLAVPTLVPFYDNDVIDFFLRVPSARLPGRRLQIAYLRRHHPDLAAITWQQTGMSLSRHWWEPGVAITRRAAAKIGRTVRRAPAIERNWELQYLGCNSPTRLRETLLADDAPIATLITKGALAQFITTTLASPDANNGSALDSLLTLNIALAAPPAPA